MSSTPSANKASCVICGKGTSLKNRRKEMCLKFTTLVSRFLNLEHNETEKNVCKKTSSSLVCSNCHILAQSFCDTYQNWESLRMEIIHIVDKISVLMRKAKSSSSSNSFRKEFISRADTKRRKHCPSLQLKRLRHSAVDDQVENSGNFPNPTEHNHIIAESLVDGDNGEDYHFKQEQEMTLAMDDDDVLHFSDGHDEVESDHSDLLQIGAKDAKTATTKRDALQNRKRGQLNHSASVKTAICPICEKGFENKYKLEIHLVSHSEVRNFICEFCQKGFKLERALQLHRRTVHLDSLKKQVCEICGKKFALPWQLQQHMISHSETRDFKCDLCPNQYKYELQLKRHKRSIHVSGRIPGQRKPYRVKPRTPKICLFCQKTFRKQSDLDKHMRSHTKEKPVLCKTCGQEFSETSAWYQHQRSFHGDGSRMRIQCEICGKAVLNIRSHCSRVHSSNPIKNAICDICGKPFSNPYRLKLHMVCHSEERNFACDICQTRFKHNSEVWRHKAKVHKARPNPSLTNNA